MTPVAFLDASVLYPSTVRSVLMFLAAFDAFRAHWSEDIQREWTAALARDRPDLDANLTSTPSGSLAREHSWKPTFRMRW